MLLVAEPRHERANERRHERANERRHERANERRQEAMDGMVCFERTYVQFPMKILGR